MSFSGKKFRRVKCENIKELLASTHANDDIVRVIKTKAPFVTYTLLDGNTLLMDLEIDGKKMSHTFRLGEEHVMKKNDGGTVKMTYTVEGNSVIKQVIKMPDGKTAYFRREFNDNEIKMIVTMDGTDLTGTIYYELVQ
ncbi:fatty acid-binding protein-like [Melitaea cinxia]|uniref:fatty acid-binding protein-like n=1 Tax=Melitaea cinxia TaxID=113334 RepID=UPI001E26F1C5|nr:fatty acid-binding protein-like [Melitaea cinxia]